MKIPFGLRIDDRRMVSPEHVDNGLGCGCICVSCLQPLVAKQGSIKEWHFAHASMADCASAVESSIHRMAKQMIIERQSIYVPALSIRREVAGATWRRVLEGEVQAEGLMELRCCREEARLDTRQPDILAIMPGGREIAIEVAFTHFCDEAKIAWIKSRGLTTLEVDISVRPEINPGDVAEILERRLFKHGGYSAWIHHADESKAVLELDESEQSLREQHADADAKQVARDAAEKAERERKAKFLDSVKDVEHETFRLGRDLTLRVARSAKRVTMKAHGYFKNVTPEVKVMILDAAGRYSGRFNTQYKVWEFWPPENRVVSLYDDLRHFVRVALEAKSKSKPATILETAPEPAPFVATRLALTVHEKEVFDERAAIMEFDGRISRNDAEERGYAEITRRRWKRFQG